MCPWSRYDILNIHIGLCSLSHSVLRDRRRSRRRNESTRTGSSWPLGSIGSERVTGGSVRWDWGQTAGIGSIFLMFFPTWTCFLYNMRIIAYTPGYPGCSTNDSCRHPLLSWRAMTYFFTLIWMLMTTMMMLMLMCRFPVQHQAMWWNWEMNWTSGAWPVPLPSGFCGRFTGSEDYPSVN